MLIFIIPLKSKSHANDWNLVSALLARTVRSACAQSCPDFRVIVVCSEIPEINFDHPSLEFVLKESVFQDERSWFLNSVLDKAKKQLVGLQKAYTYNPSHFMLLDADDCVSNRLSGFVAENNQANGWFFNRGYFHMKNRSLIHFQRRNFHMWCGSSHILKLGLLQPDEENIENTRFGHKRIRKQLTQLGTPIRSLPFPGAVYNISHGENINDYGSIIWPEKLLPRIKRRLLYQRQLTPVIRSEFGLYPLDILN